MINYLSAEDQIVQRLKDQIPDLAEVYVLSDLSEVSETQLKFPCAYVIYQGDRVATGNDGRSSSRECQLVDQEWYVILGIRNVTDQITGKAARMDAGPIIFKILKAIQGWQPTPEHSPMTRVNGARPGYKTGYLYIPFLFTTRITA